MQTQEILDELKTIVTNDGCGAEDLFDIVTEWIDDRVYLSYREGQERWEHNDAFLPMVGTIAAYVADSGCYRAAHSYASGELEKYADGENEDGIDASRTYLVFLLVFLLADTLEYEL